MYKKFKNRRASGRALAEKLSEYKNRKDVVVLALPRGGVPVAYEVATALNVPLDVFLVRKLGVPFREELAFGAIASGGFIVFNEGIVESFKIPSSLIEKVRKKEQAELERREKLYRSDTTGIDLCNKTVILVDDGIATGASMQVALVAIRQLKPKQIIVAVPVASTEVCNEIQMQPNVSCVCMMTPEPFYGVGMWYRDFSQTNNREVCDLLAKVNDKNIVSNLRKRRAA